MPLQEIRQLANLMTARVLAGERPYTLVLGSEMTFVSEAVTQIVGSNDRVSMFQALKGLSQDERYVVLSSAWAHLPVPASYEFLAGVINLGYFDVVLTTDPSNGLESALIDSGFRLDQFNIITLGKDNQIDRRLEGSTPRVKIVKLRGDILSRSLMNVLPAEAMQRIEPSTEAAFRSLIDRDSIIVGLAPEDFDIERYVRASGGSLWLVSRNLPAAGSFAATMVGARSSARLISGPAAQPDLFFNDLSQILYAPGLKSVVPEQVLIKQSADLTQHDVPIESPAVVAQPSDARSSVASNNEPVKEEQSHSASVKQETPLSRQGVRVLIMVGGTLALFFGAILLFQAAPNMAGVSLVALFVIACGVVLATMGIIAPEHLVKIISHALNAVSPHQEEKDNSRGDEQE
jgi:hypothetical protein